MRKLVLFLFVCFIAQFVYAQPARTFTSPNYNRTTGEVMAGFTTCFTMTVAGLPNGGIINGKYGLASVKININYPTDGDLIVILTAPNGDSVTLATLEGSSGANYTNTVFTETATVPIADGLAPFTGSFTPDGTLGGVNDGQNGNNVWTLCVLSEGDLNPNGDGYLKNWSLTFDSTPAPLPPPLPTCNTLSNTATGDCANAPLVCNFNGFCGATSLAYEPPHVWNGLTNTFCGSIECNSFIKFVAGDTTASFYIWVYNSTFGYGIQTFFFNDVCDSGTPISHGCNHQLLPTNGGGPEIISATNLTPGQSYYLMFDGYAGDFCNYTVEPHSGVSFFNVKANPATANVCKGTPVNFSVTTGGPDSSTATYKWTSSITPSGLNLDTGRNVTVNTDSLNIGRYYYTVTGTSTGGCPAIKTDTINIVDPLVVNPTPVKQSVYVGYPVTPIVANTNTGGVTGVTYQWYIDSTDSNIGGTAIVGADSATYTPPDSIAGTFYYYCVVDNGGCTTVGKVCIVTVTVPPVCNNPDSIKFVQQPTTTPQGYFITPAITVEEYCSATGVISTKPGFVTLTASNGGCGYVSQTEPFVKGIATFDSVLFTRSVQNNITVTASSAGFPSVVSTPFTITGAPASEVKKIIRSDDFSPAPIVSWTPPVYGPVVVVTGTGVQGTDVSGVVNPTGTNYYMRKSYSRNNRVGGYGTTNTFTFDTVQGLGVYDTLDFYFKVASLNSNGISVAGNGAGVNASQDLVVETSIDGGNTWQNLITHQGGNNKLFQFDSTNVATLALGASAVYPPTDSTSAFHVAMLPKIQGISQFQFRVTATDNRINQNWSIDDIALIGTNIIAAKEDTLPGVIALKSGTICLGSAAQLSAEVSNAEGTVVYDWSPASGLANPADTSLANPTTAVLANTESYSLTITDKDNCVAKSNIITISVKSAITATIKDSICSGNVYIFNGKNYSQAGSYSDTSLSKGGCDSITTLVLTVKSPSSFTIDTTICVGSTYTFNGVGYDSTGTYSAHFTNSVGCDSVSTLSLNVVPAPVPTVIYGPTTVQVGNTITLFDTTSGGISGKWGDDTTTAIIIGMGDSVVVKGVQPGIAIVYYTESNSCGSDIASYRIAVTGAPDVFVPNVFTPNGTVNKTLYVRGDASIFTGIEFRVFDSWGGLLFDKSGSLNDVGWDGKFNGKMQPSGVYLYVAKITLNGGGSIIRKGFVNLVQ